MARVDLRARAARVVRLLLRRRGLALVPIDESSYHWLSRVDARRGLAESLAAELAHSLVRAGYARRP